MEPQARLRASSTCFGENPGKDGAAGKTAPASRSEEGTYNLLIRRYFLGVFRFAKMALAEPDSRQQQVIGIKSYKPARHAAPIIEMAGTSRPKTATSFAPVTSNLSLGFHRIPRLFLASVKPFGSSKAIDASGRRLALGGGLPANVYRRGARAAGSADGGRTYLPAGTATMGQAVVLKAGVRARHSRTTYGRHMQRAIFCRDLCDCLRGL